MNHFRTIASKRSFSKGFARFRVRKEKGIALIVSLLIIVLLTLLAVAGLRTSIVEEQISGNQKLAAKALFAAEQGVSEALEGLLDGTISDSGSETDTAWSAVGSASGAGYSVDYTVSHHLVGGSVLVSEDGRTYYRIDSTGNASELARRLLEVVVAMELGGAGNTAGLIGCQGILSTNNVITGSYSSSGQPSDGEKGDIATTDSDAFINMPGATQIIGEARSTGSLFIEGNTIVLRDALAPISVTTQGMGHVYGSVYTNGSFSGAQSSVSGDINQGPSVYPDPVVPPEPCDPLDIDSIFSSVAVIQSSNDNVDLVGIYCEGAGANCFDGTSFFADSDDSVILGETGQSKVYYFFDFQMNAQTMVTFRGDVRIYMDNNFVMSSQAQLIFDPGATVKIYMENGRFWVDSNTSQNEFGVPANFQIYSKAVNVEKEPGLWEVGQEMVTIDSNSGFYGVIYAPRAHVVINSNTEVHGSVRGIFLTMDSNFNFWYDEDLDNMGGGGATEYQMVYWTEQYPE